jgi:hypothetical protein
MKTLFAALAVLIAPLHAGESVTLVAENAQNQTSESQSITLEKGESAELKFTGQPSNIQRVDTDFMRLALTVGGKNFEVPALSMRVYGPTNSDAVYETTPFKIAGPAVVKLRIGRNTGAPVAVGFATFDVQRLGTSNAPIPIPAEAGTTWTVLLESSSDLVNWTAIQPGDYPSSTPQRYFRTRLVKKP